MSPYSNKLQILSELFLKYKHEPGFADFYVVNDLGLPLAFLEMAGFAKADPSGKELVEETWRNLCVFLDVDPETDWQTLDEMFVVSDLVQMD